MDSILLIEVLVIVTLNLWSKRVLKSQVPNSGHENETDKLKRKRNQKAVGILNIITMMYTLCTFPLSCYYYLGVSVFMYDKGDKILLNSVHNLYNYVHLPVLLYSGFNALAYMLKDKAIKGYYSRRVCFMKKSIRKRRKDPPISSISPNNAVIDHT